MNIKELKGFSNPIGVPKRSYNIDSDGTVITPGTISLKRVSTGFFVYWIERNEIYEQRYFKDEAKVVSYFLFCLKVALIHTVNMYWSISFIYAS